MNAAKPKVMSIECGDTAYKGTHVSAGITHAKQQFKSEKPKEIAIVWVEDVKLDRMDILFNYDDSFEGSAKGDKAKDEIGHEVFHWSLAKQIHENGVTQHPVKGKPGQKGKQDCYSQAVGFSCGKSNLYTLKCDNILNKKAAFCKLSTIPSEMLRLSKVDNLFYKILHLTYHGPNAMSTVHKPVAVARVSRVDLAYDVAVNLADYCIYASSVKKTDKVGKNNPSRYLGNNCIFYDKKVQLLDKKGLHITQPYMMRMEVTLPRNKVPENFPEGLLDTPNPLLKLRPYLKEKVYQYLHQNGYSHLVDTIEVTDLKLHSKGFTTKNGRPFSPRLMKWPYPTGGSRNRFGPRW